MTIGLRGLLSTICAATCIAAVTGYTEARAETVLRFGHYGAPADAVTKAGEKFQQLVAEKTGGALKINVYPGLELGNSAALVQGARMGTVDISCTGNPYFTGFAPAMNLIDLPFLLQDNAHVEKVMDGPIGRELMDKLEQYRLKGLALWEIGFRNVTNNERPIRVPEDMQGLKIRTTPNPAHVQAFKILGANPTPMPFAEVYVALETGTVDGQENPVHHIYANRLHEVQKHMSLTRHAYTASPVVMNLAKFNGLPPDQQSALIEAAVEAGKFERELNQKLDKEALGKIKAAGVEVVEDPDVDAFRKLVADETRKAYVEAHGGELLDKIVDAAK